MGHCYHTYPCGHLWGSLTSEPRQETCPVCALMAERDAALAQVAAWHQAWFGASIAQSCSSDAGCSNCEKHFGELEALLDDLPAAANRLLLANAFCMAWADDPDAELSTEEAYKAYLAWRKASE